MTGRPHEDHHCGAVARVAAVAAVISYRHAFEEVRRAVSTCSSRPGQPSRKRAAPRAKVGAGAAALKSGAGRGVPLTRCLAAAHA